MGARAQLLSQDIDVTAPFVRERLDTPDAMPAPHGPAECHEQVGRYLLRYTLATGGMATVYLAVTHDPDESDTQAHQAVALKRMHPHLAVQKEYVEMFLDEARITALIRHPNVCGVVDYGVVRGGGSEGGDAWWLAMELLAGEPLARWTAARAARRGEPMLEARWPFVIARVLSGACAGLHAAHELRDSTGRALDVVHRDVSPHNLLVGFDGRAKVVDFGIALAAQRVHHTAAGLVKGKFAYMAPEQMRGHKVDRRADVWSLGVVLWESLAGRPLFRGPTDSETILAVLAAEVPPLRAFASNVPESLCRIVERAVRLDPRERYATAAEMGRELAAVAETTDAEVAAWLEHLFPAQRAQHQALVRNAILGAGRPRRRPTKLASIPSNISQRLQRSSVRRAMRHAAPRRAWTVATLIVLSAVLLALVMIFEPSIR